MTQIALMAYVTLDLVPGAFHDEESAKQHLQGMLSDRMAHYNPIVAYPPADVPRPDPNPRRKIFLIYVTLDESPGMMHTKQSAHNTVRTILRERIPQYSPVVSYALARLQPEYTEGTVEA
jgi:hypothetical protein